MFQVTQNYNFQKSHLRVVQGNFGGRRCPPSPRKMVLFSFLGKDYFFQKHNTMKTYVRWNQEMRLRIKNSILRYCPIFPISRLMNPMEPSPDFRNVSKFLKHRYESFMFSRNLKSWWNEKMRLPFSWNNQLHLMRSW